MILGKVLRRYRLYNENPAKELAAQIGVSTETLTRFERGGEITGETMAKIWLWLLAEEKEPKE
jgi:DNA-binding Xre family transcriptional regulator